MRGSGPPAPPSEALALPMVLSLCEGLGTPGVGYPGPARDVKDGRYCAIHPIMMRQFWLTSMSLAPRLIPIAVATQSLQA